MASWSCEAKFEKITSREIRERDGKKYLHVTAVYRAPDGRWDTHTKNFPENATDKEIKAGMPDEVCFMGF